LGFNGAVNTIYVILRLSGRTIKTAKLFASVYADISVVYNNKAILCYDTTNHVKLNLTRLQHFTPRWELSK